MAICLAYQSRTGANSEFIGICNQAPLRIPKMQDKKLLMLC